MRYRPGTHQFLRWALRPRGQTQDADYLRRLAELLAPLDPNSWLARTPAPRDRPLKAIVTCAVCGTRSEQPIVTRASETAPPDLDTGPPFDLEPGLSTWVQRCPQCGYCAEKISQSPGDVQAILESSQYRRQLNDSGLPSTAASFLCRSQIEESTGQSADAVLSCLCAVWICDDAAIDSASQRYRLKAVDRMRHALKAGQAVDPMIGGDETLMTDLLRRSGRLDDALVALDGALQKEPEPVLRLVLSFQRQLIARGDTTAHSLVEALRKTPSTS